MHIRIDAAGKNRKHKAPLKSAPAVMCCIPWRSPGRRFNQVTHYAAWLNGCWQSTRYGRRMPCNWLLQFNGARGLTTDQGLVTFDQRMREAAYREGFTVLPDAG